MMEALACHPLGPPRSPVPENEKLMVSDTIKVRMQLSRRKRAPGVNMSISRKALKYLQGSRENHAVSMLREEKL